MSFQGYQIERTLRDGPLGAVHVVRPDGADAGPRMLLRTCVVDPTFAAPHGEYDYPRVFFARASTQRRLAEKARTLGESQGDGGGHLVAVHDLVATSTGGYCVTDLYTLSVRQLIGYRFRPSGPVLYGLMRGLLVAIRQVARAAGGRPHGAIEPRNVLIDADGPVGAWRVGLTGIVPRDELDENWGRGQHQDLRNAGLLLYSLVTHQPFRQFGGYPIQDAHGHWASIGEHGEAWLAIANKLLDPAARPGAFDVDGLIAQIDGLAEKAKDPRPLIALGGIAAMVAIAGGITAVLLLGGEKPLPPSAEFDPQKAAGWIAGFANPSGWLDEFYSEEPKADMDRSLWFGPELRARVEAEPGLSDIADPIGRVAERETALLEGETSTLDAMPELDPVDAYVKQIGLKSVLHNSIVTLREEVEEGIASGRIDAEAQGSMGGFNRRVELLIDVINEDLDGWTRENLLPLAETWESRNWIAGAAQLRAGASGARIRTLEEIAADPGAPTKPLAPILRSLLDLRDSAARVEADRQKVADDLLVGAGAGAGKGDAPEDPFLTGLGQAITVWGGPGMTLEEIGAGLGELRGMLEGEDGLLAFVRGPWQTDVDRLVFAREVSPQRFLDEPDLERGIEAWLGAARDPAYRVLRGADDPRGEWVGEPDPTGIRAALTQIDAWGKDQRYADRLAKHLGLWESERGGGFEAQASELLARVDALMGRRAYGGVRDELAERFAGLKAEADALALAYKHDIYDNVAVQWGEYVPGLRSREQAPGVGLVSVNDAWRARRDELIAHHGLTQDAPGIYGDVQERLIPALQEVEDAVRAEVSFDAVPAGFDADAFAEVVQARNESEASGLLDAIGRTWGGGAGEGLGYDTRGPVYRQAIGAARAERDAWVKASEAFVRDMARVEELLGDGYRYDERADSDGLSLQILASGLLGSEFLKGEQGETVRGLLGGLAERLELVKLVYETPDAARLVETGVRTPILSVAITGYERLGANGGAAWPRVGSGFDRDAELLASLRERVVSLGDAADRDRIGSWLRGVMLDRWRSAMRSASNEDELRTVFARADMYGVDPSLEDARTRLNLGLVGLDGIDRSDTRTDAEVRADVRRASERLEAIAAEPGARVPAEVSALIALLAELSVERPDDEEKFDFGTVGPGRAGWRASVTPFGEKPVVATYTKDGTELRFVIVEPRGAEGVRAPYAICTEEVSVRLFDMLVRADGGDAASWIGEGPPASLESTSVRAWTFDRSTGAFGVNDQWLGRYDQNWDIADGYPPYAPGFQTDADRRLTRRPTGASPMNYVSISAAERAAAAMGCRLPTDAEWRVAYAMYEAATPQGAWNRIDGDFTSQVRYGGEVRERFRARGLETVAENFPWPGSDVYDVTLFRRDRDWAENVSALPNGAGDGLLWFDGVDAPRGAHLKNMIGNVAELVRVGGIEAGILGGSSLSRPREVSEEAGSVVQGAARAARYGYSDVGFRLAFSAEGYKPSVADQLADLIERRVFVFGGR